MSTVELARPQTKNAEIQLATFYLGELLLGLEINRIQEINRNLDITKVPHSPDYVRGVINLRGDVATVIDLRTVLGLPPAEATQWSRNLIVHSHDELVGLWVDRVADTITITADQVDLPPANVSGIDGRFFRGVYATESNIVVILDLDETLSAS